MNRGGNRLQQLIYYCERKPGAQRDYPFGPEPLVMKVAGKMFALISSDSISLKCNPVIAQNLREQHASVKPGYHLNKKHWNTVTVDGTLSELELQAMIDHSYKLVVASLTKLARAELAEA
jgi:predicted DNA-binding protein (MmcQ/YjbR family)